MFKGVYNDVLRDLGTLDIRKECSCKGLWFVLHSG